MLRTSLLALTLAAAPAWADGTATVVEIATFDLAEGVSVDAFAPVDAQVEADHVSQQPGFVSRETGVTDGKWVAIVHWESLEDAQASMDSFATAPAAADFMSMMDVSTMVMTRYSLNP